MARPASDIAERIVRAARDRFLEEGVEGASLRAIARDAGTNLGMVYYYYPNKDDLFLAVVETVYGRLLEDTARVVSEAGPDTGAKVARLYARLSAVSDEEMTVMRLIIREAIASPSSRMALLFERFSRGHVMMMGAMLQNGIQRGDVRSDVPTFVLVMCTLCLGLFPQVVRRRLSEAAVPVDVLFPSPTELAQKLAQVLMEGLSPRAAVLSPDAPALKETAMAPAKKAESAASKARAATPKSPKLHEKPVSVKRPRK